MAMKILRIKPAAEKRNIVITEPLSFSTNVLRNRLLYRGDPSKLDQFYKQTAIDAVSRFWAAVPSADLDGIALETDEQSKLWEEITEDNDFDELVGESIIDTDVTKFPIIEFFVFNPY